MAEICTRTVDGRLIEAFPVMGGDLFMVIIDGEPQDDFYSRLDIQNIISGLVTLSAEDFSALREGDVYLDSGQQGVVFTRSDPNIVTKLVFLPSSSLPLSNQRLAERRRSIDPWGSLVGSTILASNRHQADLFRSLAKDPGPPSLPRVLEYREGKLDNYTIERLIASGIPEERLPPPGWPVAAWVMERLQPANPSEGGVDDSRRQVLDYLWNEHDMVARDLAGDSGNWAQRSDGELVAIDPLVVSIPMQDGRLPTSLHGTYRKLDALKRSDTNQYIKMVAPFGDTLESGRNSLAMALLSISLAYRVPDPLFTALVADMRGNSPSHPVTYLGYPFM